jgi:hypothetical protein
MNRVLISLLSLGAIVSAGMFVPVSMAHAKIIACAAKVPVPPKGPWSYRVVDGRKCWYRGKAMISRALLRWPKEVAAKEAGSAAKAEPPSTTEASVVAAPASAPVAWPTPVVDEMTFEARWRGLMLGR